MYKKLRQIGLILFFSLFLGIVFTCLLNSPLNANQSTPMSRGIVSQINNEKIDLRHKEEQIRLLTREYKQLEKKTLSIKDILSEEDLKKYDDYKRLIGKENVLGEGIIIKIESNKLQENIAFSFDKDRVLLKIINLAKVKGAESISINNQAINGNTGIVLAGNHINVNNVPVTPPYEIRIIGNDKGLYRYFKEESVYMLRMSEKYNVSVDISQSKAVKIPKILTPKEIENIEVVR